MNLLQHNIKVALRNLMKYKLQTAISVLSLAIGMLTLSIVYSALQKFSLPLICSQPYYDDAYVVSFDSIQNKSDDNLGLSGGVRGLPISAEIIRAIKENGGLNSIEQGPYVPNRTVENGWAEYTLGDGFRRRMATDISIIDCHYPHYKGMRSSITGKIVKILKKNEAIICQSQAQKIFGDRNPIGAKLMVTMNEKVYHLTISDVYEDLGNMERVPDGNNLYFSPYDLEDMNFETYYSVWLDVVLKEGRTPQQLEAEVNAHVKPLGLKAKVEKLKDVIKDKTMAQQIGMSVAYLIGSLILLAAIISFLRMQTQLFWMRRREISLRITNGASRWHLFSMFATETLISIVLACVISIIMGMWFHDVIWVNLKDLQEEIGGMEQLWVYEIWISIGVLLLCLLVVGGILSRIGKNAHDLTSKMKKAHSHWFRNIMLGVQVAISIFFVSTTLSFMQFSAKTNEFTHIPQATRLYKESLWVDCNEAENHQQLTEYLVKLPEVKSCIPVKEYGFIPIQELSDKKDITTVIWNRGGWSLKTDHTNFQTFGIADSSWIDYLGMSVNWLPKVSKERGILVSEKLYKKMRQYRIASNNRLTIRNDEVYPIVGTFKYIPYYDDNWDADFRFVVIDPAISNLSETSYILVAKEGEFKQLEANVRKTIARLEPAVVKPMAQNLHEHLASRVVTIDTLQTMAQVLSLVSLIICMMSIFSTVMLDARTRRKEVAIRKVNGAMTKDIVKLFGKVYLVIVVLASIIAALAARLFGLIFDEMGSIFGFNINYVISISLGIIGVALLIFGIVAWQIKAIMKIDPSEILAKE